MFALFVVSTHSREHRIRNVSVKQGWCGEGIHQGSKRFLSAVFDLVFAQVQLQQMSESFDVYVHSIKRLLLRPHSENNVCAGGASKPNRRGNWARGQWKLVEYSYFVRFLRARRGSRCLLYSSLALTAGNTAFETCQWSKVDVGKGVIKVASVF